MSKKNLNRRSFIRNTFLASSGITAISAFPGGINPSKWKNKVVDTSEKEVTDFRTRQVHLDFHTSEHVENIGAEFNKKQFQEALQLAHVNSINVFAKGWHGWSYYNTKVGHQHPHLDFDLLKAQIEACHEINVKAPVYFASSHAETDLERHPEWMLRDKKGNIVARGIKQNASPDTPRRYGAWTHIAPINSYLEMAQNQVKEICENYDVDGFWFDGIYTHPGAYNPEILAEMTKLKLDTDNDEAVWRYTAKKWNQFMANCSQIIKNHHPEASIFFNSTTFLQSKAKNVELKNYRFNTQNDLEDLPTTPWGWYDKFPLRSKFFHNEDKPVVAMSGKFHEGWGEFGGYKHPDAMKYEAAAMISYGAACNFGDQLHPSGKMDMATYRNIGKAFEYVKKIENYGFEGKPFSNLGLWFSDVMDADEGVSNMLLEAQMDYEVIDTSESLKKYEIIIIPSGTTMNAENAQRIKNFVSEGGKLLVIGKGALNSKNNEFILPVGVNYLKGPNYDIDYMLVEDKIDKEIVNSPFLLNSSALVTAPQAGTEILAKIVEPYFSRTYGHYFSHRNTPPKTEPAKHPAIVKNGNVIYFAHDIDRVYHQYGVRLHRDVFINALNLLHKKPVLQVKMPSSGRVSLLHQPGKKRYVAHLLYATPIKRGKVHVIEDLVPVYNIPVTLEVPERIKKVYTVPAMEELKTDKSRSKISLTVPKVKMHNAVVFEYE